MTGNLTAWKFPTATGADTAVHTLKELRKEHVISTNLSHEQEAQLRPVFAD